MSKHTEQQLAPLEWELLQRARWHMPHGRLRDRIDGAIYQRFGRPEVPGVDPRIEMMERPALTESNDSRPAPCGREGCVIDGCPKCREASEQELAPAKFRIDVPDIDCVVAFDPNVKHEGESVRGLTDTGYDGHPYIALRDQPLDQTVLLHEVLHVIIRSTRHDGTHDLTNEVEEALVRRIERALFAMGWRWERREPGFEHKQRAILDHVSEHGRIDVGREERFQPCGYCGAGTARPICKGQCFEGHLAPCGHSITSLRDMGEASGHYCHDCAVEKRDQRIACTTTKTCTCGHAQREHRERDNPPGPSWFSTCSKCACRSYTEREDGLHD